MRVNVKGYGWRVRDDLVAEDMNDYIQTTAWGIMKKVKYRLWWNAAEGGLWIRD